AVRIFRADDERRAVAGEPRERSIGLENSVLDAAITVEITVASAIARDPFATFGSERPLGFALGWYDRENGVVGGPQSRQAGPFFVEVGEECEALVEPQPQLSTRVFRAVDHGGLLRPRRMQKGGKLGRVVLRVGALIRSQCRCEARLQSLNSLRVN